MPRRRYRIDPANPTAPHFVSGTITGGLAARARAVVDFKLDSWRFLRRNEPLALFGDLIPENRPHRLAAARRLGCARTSTA